MSIVRNPEDPAGSQHQALYCVSNPRGLAQTVLAHDCVMMSTVSSVVIQMVWKRPISSCDLVSLTQAGIVNKPCGRYAAVNPVYVGLVTSVVGTDPYWQQWHGHNLALYYLLAN